jgi:hypothetical protein
MTRAQPTDKFAQSVPIKGRYRRIEVRTWGDEKFRALSPMPPSGQGLWLYLVAGPFTSPIPGLFSAGPAAMAEDLGWSPEAFADAMSEAIALGMVRVNTGAKLVWLPNAIRHNPPGSLNVVKSWGAEFNLLPECDLKREAFEALKVSIHALGKAFGDAFDKSWAKPSAKPSGKASGMPRAIQEQEQEVLKTIQNQDQDRSLTAGSFVGPSEETLVPKSAAGRVCFALRQIGIGNLNPGHPDLLALIEAGATEAEFVGAAQAAIDRGKGSFPYLLGTLKRQRVDAAQSSREMHRGPLPQAPPRETNYARSQREKMAQFAPGVAAKAPGAIGPETIEMEAANVAPRRLG